MRRAAVRWRREISILRGLGFFLPGIVASIQATSYLWDAFDDGQSEPLSGIIALVLIGLGVGFVVWSFREDEKA